MPLFPVPEEEKIEISGKIREFVELIEAGEIGKILERLAALDRIRATDERSRGNDTGADAEACI